MNTYAAFLGHQPMISLAELNAVIPDLNLKDVIGKHIALFETEEDLSQEHLDTWGGTVILAKELAVLPYNEEEDDILNMLQTQVPRLLSQQLKVRKRGQVTFSLRTFGLLKAHIKALYRSCKQFLKSQGRPSRYVGNDRKSAATALLHDANLIDDPDGCEISIVKGEDSIWIGRTVGAQDPNGYAWRDMEKPVRDTKVGLLPPKLAQIMLNFGEWLTQENESLTVFDPFCGTGVIPMEALLNGWTVYASDKSQKAVGATTENLEWIRKEENIKKKEVPSTVWKHDACKPFELKDDVHIIVTETTLGPPLEKRPSATDVKKWKSENEKLQAEFLKNTAATLPSIPIVCMWPVWYLKTGPVFLEKVFKTIEKEGYTPVLPEVVSTKTRPTLLYRRPDQFVGREIILLSPRPVGEG
jgi:tRNA G10  N-methylase Trm11